MVFSFVSNVFDRIKIVSSCEDFSTPISSRHSFTNLTLQFESLELLIKRQTQTLKKITAQIPNSSLWKKESFRKRFLFNSSLEKILSESGTPFGESFKTTVKTSLPLSEIFKAMDVSGGGNNKESAKKLLENIKPISPQESLSCPPEIFSFAKHPPFTKEEINGVTKQ
ncbi:hypothetical protein CDAR_36301 [Caerostris darwini]|uniref:Uncharacterized protein n=1 Tax=Caerostris darwini TaxID=1538125 RepID=A0AAV4R9L9_9ARAC|nr:hypothetical protein CDAR_36301 [Caerostris darwini]